MRFLPAFDSIILAHRDRSRIVPARVLRRRVQQEERDDEADVHGRRLRRRRVAHRRKRGAWQLDVEPFAPLPAKVRREVDAEGERLRRVLRVLDGEERQLGLALAAQHREVDLDAGDAAALGERDRLRLDLLRGEDAAAGGARRVGADAVEVAA